MATNKTGLEVGVSVDQSLLIKVLDAEGLEAAQMTLTVDWVIATVPGPDPEPPPIDEDIIEQIYTPEEYGGDVVLMGQTILKDQESLGNLRAVVQFQRGKTYEYTRNNWMTGIQRYRCEAVGQGARPKLRNSNRNASMWVDRGPLCVGKGANCFTENNAPMSKTHAMALIANAKVGDNTVTLQNAGDGGRLKPGRWHAVFSYAQQIGGYPPNCRWIDYVLVEAVDGTRVTLDRPLGHDHWADYWEDPNDQQSVGKARIGLMDGAYNDTRCTLEGTWRGLEFVGEDQAGMDTCVIESHIEALFEDCLISNPWPTISKRVEFRNCILTGAGDQAAEPDKMGEEIVFDGVTQAKPGQYVQAASGWEKFTIRNSNLNCVYIKPHYLTVENTVIDSHGDTKFYVPVSWAYNGPCLEATFTDCDIRATTAAQPTWAYSQAPVTPLPLSSAAWSGKKLIIQRGFTGFENWLVWAYEGAMVFTGARVFNPGNYGRIDKIHAPPDGSQLWLDITWIKGSKPTSGSLNLPHHGLRKLIWNNTRITQGNWLEPDFIAMDGTPEGARGFPDGID